MGDSDDEYDRKRRDKFRGERAGTGSTEGNSYRSSDRREERTRTRDDWPESRSRGGRAGPDYRDYRGGGTGGTRGYSPVRGDGPPTKRMRSDWGMDDRRYGGVPHDPYGAYSWPHDPYGPHPAHQAYGHHMQPVTPRDAGALGSVSGDSLPSMMSFKAFLAAQDDAITDEDAIKKYNEYKQEFRRQQLNEFFVAHKDEEWFKLKYHPEESLKRKEEQLNSLKNRLSVFLELLDTGELDKVSVDMENSDPIIRLLDTVVIKLEGGTEEDLKVLDEPIKPAVVEVIAPAKPAEEPVSKIENGEQKEESSEEKPKSPKDAAPLTMDIDPHHKQLQEQAKLFSIYNAPGTEIAPEINEAVTEEPPPPAVTKSKRKREDSGSASSSSSGSSSSSSSSSSEDEAEAEVAEKDDKEIVVPGEETKEIEKTEDGEEEDKKSVKIEKEEKEQGQEEADDDSEVKSQEDDKKEDGEDAEKEEEITEPKKEMRALHKTTSIFLRNLSPTITKAEVEAMCKRYGGFLRVALADPLPERRWFRRGWVSFQREVNIKEICWNLNNIRLRECELGAIVNRDLSRRVRPAPGVTRARVALHADARLAAKLAHHLDARSSLWPEPARTDSHSFGLLSENPVLKNITEHLIEEASAEEDELLGTNGGGDSDAGAEPEVPVEGDPQLKRVLDRLVLYLRVVHSVDYYNHCEYPYEDEMPNRCGIMHARGPAPNKMTTNEVSEYIRTFESKMSAFLQDTVPLSDDDLHKLGAKDCEAEVEKFILANTQELAKDKWLCPLSGKKFKGPDFIRKHIFNKHGEKVEEVRKEVEYFNSYLRDVRRPALHEPALPAQAAARRPEAAAMAPPQGYGSYGYGRGSYGGYSSYYPSYTSTYSAPRHNRSFARGREGYSDRSRPLIAYNDLDLPENGDLF